MELYRRLPNMDYAYHSIGQATPLALAALVHLVDSGVVGGAKSGVNYVDIGTGLG
jgi:hypothetical protein